MIFRSRLFLLFSLFLPLSCSKSTVQPQVSEEAKKVVIRQYAELVHATYQDALAGAKALDAAVNTFTKNPSAETLQKAKEAWLASRPPYLQTEVFRFYDGPIDDKDGPEPLMNSWPMDESFIDYTKDDPKSGIIQHKEKFAEITTELLVDVNAKESETTIASGYHAIEFLLWGQDLNADGPGNRPYTDYAASNPTAARRAIYLNICSNLLVANLKTLIAAWAPNTPGNYRAAFVSAPPDESLSKILLGMGSLSGGELAGERMTVAYESKEQEDEHSCFSDNTHVDHLNDDIGIQNIYLGIYKKSDGTVLKGPGIKSLIDITDPALAAKLAEQFDASIAAIKAIPHPFDQAILGEDAAPGRVAIKKAIEALRAQTTTIGEAAGSLGLKINLE